MFRTAETSLMEIAEMQSNLIQNLETQSESIQQMEIDSLARLRTLVVGISS